MVLGQNRISISVIKKTLHDQAWQQRDTKRESFRFLKQFCVDSPKRPSQHIYLFKANNRSTRTTCEICSKLPIKTLE